MAGINTLKYISLLFSSFLTIAARP